MGSRNVAPLALLHGLPEPFVERMTALFGESDAQSAIESFRSDKSVFARVNTLKTTVPEAIQALGESEIDVERVPWMQHGVRVPLDRRGALVAHPWVEDGSIYIQGASSWLPVLALGAEPAEEVLDLAAAPGGKSLHLAAQMENRGRLACVEPIKPRFFRLKANLERGGVSCARLYLKDGRRVGGAVPERFDRVLLDAPCSSEAQFRADMPETWAHWGPRKIKEQSRKQRGLLLSAWQALKPGGRLVYATCSLAPEEDELVVSHLLQRADGARVIPPDLADDVPAHPGLTEWAGKALDPRLVGARRIRPTSDFDAFFFAVLHKAG